MSIEHPLHHCVHPSNPFRFDFGSDLGLESVLGIANSVLTYYKQQKEGRFFVFIRIGTLQSPHPLTKPPHYTHFTSFCPIGFGVVILVIPSTQPTQLKPPRTLNVPIPV